MKIKVKREITFHRVYETIVEFDPEKDNPYYLDDTDEMELVADVIGDDSTYFHDLETDELVDLIHLAGY